MLAHLNMRRPVRALSLFTVAIALLAVFPQRPADAQPQSVLETLDDKQNEFASGVFQRTSLSPDINPVPTIPADASGAVQLAPVGVLKAWEKVVVELPDRSPAADDGRRSDAGVVALGSRLFVIAGTVNTPGPTNTGSTASVLIANVNQVLGDIVPHNVANTDPRYVDDRWLNDPLPALTAPASHFFDCADTTAARTRSAVSALSTGPSSGFIYVVGGLISTGSECEFGELTSNTVQIGAVAADGDITWSIGPDLPSAPLAVGAPNPDPRGVEKATATVVRTSSGKAFLYVIGGLSTFNRQTPVSRVEQSVFYAEINSSSGALGAWVRGDDIPVVDPTPGDDAVGLYDHAATAVTTTFNSGASSVIKDGIVVAGGFAALLNTEPNNFVYRATIDSNSGAPTWDQSPSVNGNNVTLTAGGHSGMAAVSYNNKLYMIGGAPFNLPAVSWVQTAVFDDNLEIQTVPSSSEYFVGNGSDILPDGGPRADIGATVMDALPPADNPEANLGSAWVFGAGGTDQNGALSRFIIRGRIGGDEADGSLRTTDGWYYSDVFDVRFQQPGQTKKNARVLSIRWATEIERGSNTNADILVDFRKTLSTNPTCPNESVFSPTAESDRWIPLDADTTSGFFSQSSTAVKPFNTVTLKDAFGSEEFIATCFQYRVRFIQNGLDTNNRPNAAASPSATPRLFSMNIEKVIAGSPDVRIAENGFKTDVRAGRMVSFDTVIRNLNLAGIDDTQSVGLNDDGSFYVNLCVAFALPGQPAPTLDLPTLPVADGQIPACSRAYYNMPKAPLTAGANYDLRYYELNQARVPQGWQRNSDNVIMTDIRELFSEPGTYKVAMLIDMWNYVPEGTAGEANNRGEEAPDNAPQILTFEITGPPVKLNNFVNLPMIRR